MRAAIKWIKYNLGTNLIGAEIGVDRGSHAWDIYNSVSVSMLFLIDTWWEYKQSHQNNPEQSMIVRRGNTEYIETIKRFWNCLNVKIIRMKSVYAADMFKDCSLDFVYIDACHDTDSVIDDILAWKPKIKTGGVLAGHDYETWQTVKDAVDKELPDALKEDNDWWIVCT